MAEQKASVALGRLDVDAVPDLHPIHELQRQLKVASAKELLVREYVANLDPDSILSRQSQAMWRMHDEAHDRLVRVADICERNGISKEQMRIQQDQGAAIVALLERVATRFGLPATERARFMLAAAVELEVLDGAA